MTQHSAQQQLFVPTFRIDECLAEIRECLEKGWTGLGFKTVEFEERWKEYTGLPHAHFLNSATAGLKFAVRLLKHKYGWEDGDEIISTPITFVSTNHAILYENMRVSFGDVDQYGCLDPDCIEDLVTPRTRGVMFVGLGGNTGKYDRIRKICDNLGLRLILDAAHMAGTRVRGKTPGADADVVVYSFHAVKNLPTADSGMVCFADRELDVLVRQQSWLGIDKDTFSRTMTGGTYKWYYDVPTLGFKDHGNSIMAAIGLVQLKYLDADNAYRRQVARWYDELLGENIKIVPTTPECESSRHLFQILVPNRDEFLLALNNAKIFPGVHYRDNSEYSMYASSNRRSTSAKAFSDSVLSLPLHLRLTRGDIEHISATILSISNLRQ
jgi:dTDP-4-amino-4,6-dideoxygalactose transaminase